MGACRPARFGAFTVRLEHLSDLTETSEEIRQVWRELGADAAGARR